MIIFNGLNDSLIKESELINALKMVIDPELNINIVDLGLVYCVGLDVDKKLLKVEMTLSSKFCPMGNSIVSATKNCMKRMFSAYETNVELIWEPEWDYSFISPEGLELLEKI